MALVVGAFLFLLGTAAWAASVAPVPYIGVPGDSASGNPSCYDLGFDYEIKSDEGGSAIVTKLIDGFLVEVEVVSDGTSFDFYANVPVKGAIAKGGPNANFYDYRPDGVLSDTGLVSPDHPGDSPPGLSHASFCFDDPVVPYLALGVEKTADGSYDRIVEWELEKSVNPASHAGNAGEVAGSSLWTVVATKTETFDNYKVDGTITITNPNVIDVDFDISDVLSDGTVATVTCDAYTVPARVGTTLGEVDCTYDAFPDDADATTNTVTVTATTPLIPQADPVDEPIDWGEPRLVGFDEGTLSDPRFDFSELIGESTTETFSEEFVCSADASLYTDGTYEYTEVNWAYLNGDIDLEASASVTVTCYLEQLDVSKTVDTSFTREHFWNIDKSVDTEDGWMLDGDAKIWLYIDGSGNETATWTVDVTYDRYEDSDFAVSGEITIENTGFDAVITAVDDVLGGAPIDVNCPVEFPYTLPAGETLTCSYGEDGYIEGDNVVTVTTERDTYSDTKAIVWDDPTTEINKTITVIDDMYEVDPLWTVTAPNSATFTYTKDFAWEAYGTDGCGSFTYLNTATIVETGQSASATLKVNVQCYLDDTAYATMGDDAICFIPTFSNWGWTNPISEGEYTWPLYAGAAQCDPERGTHVGNVTVTYNGGFDYGIVLFEGNVLMEEHVYAGSTPYPQVQRGRRTVDTVAPGQYYIEDDLSGGIYVIVHAVVMYPDPNFDARKE